MRRQFILATLACVVGMGCGVGASAHEGYAGGGYRDAWYRAYEREREAAERYRLRREERYYERYMANKRYRRHYPDYGWRHRHHGHYGRYYHRYGHGPYYGYEYSSYWYHKPKYHYWQPKYYRTGGNAWWKRMDREGRGGQQE